MTMAQSGRRALHSLFRRGMSGGTGSHRRLIRLLSLILLRPKTPSEVFYLGVLQEEVVHLMTKVGRIDLSYRSGWR